MKELIQKLVETTGPSGYENAVRALVRAEVESLADDVRVDALGNLIVRKGEKKDGGLRVMLSAHMDEIGIIATHIDERGFVRFTSVGGLYPNMLLGSRVRFLNGQPGVIGGEKLDAGERLHPMEKLFIDVGATSREDCPVQVGDMAIFDRPFVDLGDRLVSKAMDDRVAVAILIETLRQLKDTPNEVYFVFSTQEEVGPRGAGTAAYGIDPELGVAVDVTRSGDTPRGVRMATCLGRRRTQSAAVFKHAGRSARGALDGSRREEARDPLPDGSAGSRLHRRHGHSGGPRRGALGLRVDPLPLYSQPV